MFVKGVNATTLDDVRAASSTSKSQLYYHFADKDALVLAVIDLQAGDILERQDQQLRRLNSIRGLERWRDAIVQGNALRSGAYGCPLGSLSSEVSDHDENARLSLAGYFAEWEGLLGQQATCWVAADGKYVFTANAGSASVSAYRVAADGTLTALGNTSTNAGTVDPVVSGDGRYLYVRTGQDGDVDEFRVRSDGSLTSIGSLNVPDTAAAEGIAAY